MYKPTNFIDKPAFFRGFKDFKKGHIINPFTDFYKSREWERGFNYLYFQTLNRNLAREGYRRNLNNVLKGN